MYGQLLMCVTVHREQTMIMETGVNSATQHIIQLVRCTLLLPEVEVAWWGWQLGASSSKAPRFRVQRWEGQASGWIVWRKVRQCPVLDYKRQSILCVSCAP